MAIDYEYAMNKWAEEKLGIKAPKYVYSVEVTTVDEGYCETCSYTRAVVVANVRKPKKGQQHGIYAGEEELDMEPAELVREVSEFIQRKGLT